MRKFTLGESLVIILVIFSLIIFLGDLNSSVPFLGLLVTLSYPTSLLFNYLPEGFWSIFLYLGFYGVLIFQAIVQIAILYFGGNFIEKLLKDKTT